MENVNAYWSLPAAEVLKRVRSTMQGLSAGEATARGRLVKRDRTTPQFVRDVRLLMGQFKSPLQLILIFAIILSAALGEFANSLIVFCIVLLSGLLGFWQERRATHALMELQQMVSVTSSILRDNRQVQIPSSEVVPGDIAMLAAGDMIPGDCLLLNASDLHVNESALTGESFPAEKEPCILPAETSLAQRRNCVFQGTSVVSGTATALIIDCGSLTEYGKISATLQKHQPLTAFEDGIRRFGYMIMRITLVLSVAILLINIYLGKPVAESILFTLALAVGMAPELLPAIVTITLSAGATRMASRKVIVKKLASIQNLGAINILCSDKTGTLTEGTVRVQASVDGFGNESPLVRMYAYLNATFESGFSNPLDEAIRRMEGIDIASYKKVDEVPYDFIRKRLGIAVSFEDKHYLIAKGAVTNILDVCTSVRLESASNRPMEEVRDRIMATYEKFSTEGFRTIGVCYKDISGDPIINKDDETDMIFLGFVVLADSFKPGVEATVKELRDAGVSLKLITGDNMLVASYAGSRIGLRTDNMLTGRALRSISDEALAVKVMEVDVFAETEPVQKERLVRAFRKSGNVVGYIGDGINDVSALHAADVGISVDTAVDVAKETADIVLLEKDLKVLLAGIREGRKTFINSLKYIFITTSANFGNMFSMAGTSLFLPFLPLLPKQILLLNFMSDLPAMTITSDNVDEELLSKPRRWDTQLIQRFMIVFGIESSLFDFITFGVLLFFFQSNMVRFQTAWFLESMVTEVLILLVIRTQRPFLKSRPGSYLIYAVGFVGVAGLVLPYTPLAVIFGMDALPVAMMAGMIAIAVSYTLVAEFTKRYFFRKINF